MPSECAVAQAVRSGWCTSYIARILVSKHYVNDTLREVCAHNVLPAAFKNVHAAQLHSRLTAGWLGAFALQMLHSLHAPGFRYVHLPQFHSLRDNLAA